MMNEATKGVNCIGGFFCSNVKLFPTSAATVPSMT